MGCYRHLELELWLLGYIHHFVTRSDCICALEYVNDQPDFGNSSIENSRTN